MRGKVNPFEPWRPTEIDVPPPLHAARPWRPPAKTPAPAVEAEPLLVEPIDAPARKHPPKPAPDPERRPRKRPASSALNTPALALRKDQKIVVGMIFALGVLGLVGLGWLGGTHIPRVAVALLAIAVCFTVGISLARRRTWTTRLGWMATGLAVASLAAWFVPTTHGVNLWSAYRTVEELQELPPGDVAGYTRGTANRREVIEEFPTFVGEIAAAEHTWFRRTADAAVENADRQLEDDPHKALAGLQQRNAELARLEHYALVQAELETARRRAVLACLKAAREEVKDLLDREQFAAVAQRGAFWADQLNVEAKVVGEEVDLRESLLAKRKQAVAARLEAARKDIAELLAADRFRAVAERGVKLASEMGDEAKTVGMTDDLDKLCAGCALFGDLDRQANRQ